MSDVDLMRNLLDKIEIDSKTPDNYLDESFHFLKELPILNEASAGDMNSYDDEFLLSQYEYYKKNLGNGDSSRNREHIRSLLHQFEGEARKRGFVEYNKISGRLEYTDLGKEKLALSRQKYPSSVVPANGAVPETVEEGVFGAVGDAVQGVKSAVSRFGGSREGAKKGNKAFNTLQKQLAKHMTEYLHSLGESPRKLNKSGEWKQFIIDWMETDELIPVWKVEKYKNAILSLFNNDKIFERETALNVAESVISERDRVEPTLDQPAKSENPLDDEQKSEEPHYKLISMKNFWNAMTRIIMDYKNKKNQHQQAEKKAEQSATQPQPAKAEQPMRSEPEQPQPAKPEVKTSGTAKDPEHPVNPFSAITPQQKQILRTLNKEEMEKFVKAGLAAIGANAQSTK